MAHKKAGGSSRNGRDSVGRRLGVKIFGGQVAIPGVGMGKDHTIFATVKGNVKFHKGLKNRTYISVLPSAEAAE
jgi:large subunit ribosomal protein L27